MIDLKPVVKQKIPPLFQEIMEVDAAVSNVKAQSVIDFNEAKKLKLRKNELRRAAENALSWNKDKGNNG